MSHQQPPRPLRREAVLALLWAVGMLVAAVLVLSSLPVQAQTAAPPAAATAAAAARPQVPTARAAAVPPAAAQPPVQTQRIKEVASVQGVRSNTLTGYGLVVGLDGTGDQSTQMPYTAQTMQNYLQQLGISLPAGAGNQLQLKNVAAVLVTAQLPAFAQPGQFVDVTVSSIGNAKSLKGGTLITAPLKGVDGQVYALAQGNIIIAGAGASANGSRVERSVPTPLQQGDTITLGLNASDFQTARRVAEAINTGIGAGFARALDGRTVEVRAPTDPNERVNLLARIEELTLNRSTPAARVVINSRTGSVVLNQAVTLGPCAIAHGNLSITISTTPSVSQPNALSQGQTVVTQRSDININQEPGVMIQLPAAPQLSDVVRALNALGANPQDLLAILQAIKAAGALNAELEVI
jgi:flagellar P-ring protein precursor FlgI